MVHINPISCGIRSWFNTFNPRRYESRDNRAPPSLDFLRRPRAARWIEFEGYKDTGRKINGWLIDKDQWIVVREALLNIKLTGFSNLRQYTTVTNKC